MSVLFDQVVYSAEVEEIEHAFRLGARAHTDLTKELQVFDQIVVHVVEVTIVVQLGHRILELLLGKVVITSA